MQGKGDSSHDLKKAALVTGASSGIGSATAAELGRQGYFVYLMGRDRDRLQTTALQCENGASILACDLKNSSEVERRLNEMKSSSIHQVTVLINNAGIYTSNSFIDTSDQEWTEHFQVNLLAPAQIARSMFSYFSHFKKGSIVNVSSTLGLRTIPKTAAYSAIKAALINLTQTIALEGGPLGIRANCVCPGLVETPIHSFVKLPDADRAKAVAEMGPLQPLGRIGNTLEIAKGIAFLAGDDSPWTTGAVLSIDGGINLT